jgi:predicted rRNA methylase YqxC with S4 and FtsJ domains
VQCRSMKNNLIFTGLSEQEGENCEGLLRDFLYYEMNIDNPFFVVSVVSFISSNKLLVPWELVSRSESRVFTLVISFSTVI